MDYALDNTDNTLFINWFEYNTSSEKEIEGK